MKEKLITKKLGVFVGMVFGAMLLAGCNGKAAEPVQAAVTGSEAEMSLSAGRLLLSVNPEIAVNYDDEGDVLSLGGLNKDGIQIIDSMEDYEGKPCKKVIRDIVGKIEDAGYFETKISGNEKILF